jgi:hypothetical protein
MLQIVFNEISAAEMAALPKEMQLDLLDEFRRCCRRTSNNRRPRKIRRRSSATASASSATTRQGLPHLFRDAARRHHHPSRAAQKHIRDFLFRAKLPMTEDDQLGQRKGFWKLIEEAQQRGGDECAARALHRDGRVRRAPRRCSCSSAICAEVTARRRRAKFHRAFANW